MPAAVICAEPLAASPRMKAAATRYSVRFSVMPGAVSRNATIRRPDAALVAAADRVAARIAKAMEGQSEVIEADGRFQNGG